jgi:transposase
VVAERNALRRRQARLDPKRLVFIDETSVASNMTRIYGRAPRGERLVQKVLHGNWKTTTFIAALRQKGVTAPFVLEGAMNGETFRAYIEQILAPTLKSSDIVFMDNVPIHKVAGVHEAIERRGAILIYLPAYSPDFNPIEQFFAKLKSVLRKFAAYTLKGAAYSIERLCKTIAACLDGISHAECTAYFAHSGYRST